MSELENNRQQIVNNRKKAFQELKGQLRHTHPSDIKKVQDIDEKQQIKQVQGNDNIINRYLAFCLVKLMVNHTKTFKYLNYNTKQNFTADAYDSNQLALLKSLESIHFVKKIKSTDSLKITTTKVTITSLGEAYVKKYIPRYKQIYRYLEQGSSSMKNPQHNHNMFGKPDLSDVFMLAITTFVNVGLYTNSLASPIPRSLLIMILTITGLMWILILLPFVIYLITHYKGIRFKSYRKENITKDTKRATRKNFVSFLKQNHIQEPDYRFGHNNNLPKISYYLFNTKKET